MGTLYPLIIVDTLTFPLPELYLTVIRCDDQRAIAMAKNPENHSRMKHVIEYFVWEKVKEGQFVVRLEQHRVTHTQFCHVQLISLIGEDHTIEHSATATERASSACQKDTITCGYPAS